MKKKYTLELTQKELLDIIDVFSDAEAMIGCAEPLNDDDENQDEIRRKQLKRFNKMLIRNGIKVIKE